MDRLSSVYSPKLTSSEYANIGISEGTQVTPIRLLAGRIQSVILSALSPSH